MTRPKKFAVGECRVRVVRGPRTDGRWYWMAERFKGTGKKHGVVVWTGWASKEEASREVAGVVAAGVDLEPSSSRRAADSGPVGTVEDLMLFWLGHREDTAKPSTLKSDRVCVRRIVPRLGDAVASRLSPDSLERYRAESERAGFATGSIALDIGKISAAWKWAREKGLVPDRDLRVPRVKVKPVRAKYTPTRAEVESVLAALAHLKTAGRQRSAPRWVHPALSLLAETGARIGEAANLRWGSIDFEHRTVLLDGKTGPRSVPVSPSTLMGLRGMGVGFPIDSVWPVTAASFDRYLGRYLERACEAADVPRWTPHGFRRYVVTALLDGGVPPHTVMAITGHSETTMLRFYATATESGMRDALRSAGLGGFSSPSAADRAK